MRTYYILVLIVATLVLGTTATLVLKRSPRAKNTAASQTNSPLKNPSLAPLTICEALRKAITYLTIPADQIKPVNETQTQFIAAWFTPYLKNEYYTAFTPEELSSYASSSYTELNKILTDRGFSIQLAPFPPENNVGIVAIQEVRVTWQQEGTRTKITSHKMDYPAATIKSGVHLYVHKNNPELILIEIATKSQDTLFCVAKKDAPLYADTPSTARIMDDLQKYTADLKNGLFKPDNQHVGCTIPMISYEQQPNLEWLLHMRIGPYLIAQALQEIIFKLNELGALAKAAVAIQLMGATAPAKQPPFLVTEPFLAWLERKNVPIPLFADYLTKNYWKDPGSF